MQWKRKTWGCLVGKTMQIQETMGSKNIGRLLCVTGVGMGDCVFWTQQASGWKSVCR